MTTQIDPRTDIAVSNFSFKNRIVNGDMRFDTKNNGTAVIVSLNAYANSADGWTGFGQPTDGVFSLTRSSLASTFIGPGFNKYLRATVTTADASLASSQDYFIEQIIKGQNLADISFGTATAKNLSLSFWVRSSLTGLFSAAFRNLGGDGSYVIPYTINSANTWEYKTAVITGDQTRIISTDTNPGLSLRFTLGTGTDWVGSPNVWLPSLKLSPSGAVNLISTLGATLDITGVQLELGSVPTMFEFRPVEQESVFLGAVADLQSNSPNILANGGFESWNYGGSLTGVTADQIPLPCDQWTSYKDGSGSYDFTQESGAGNFETGLYSLKVNVTSTGSSTWMLVDYKGVNGVPNPANYRNKTLTLSVRVKTSAANKIRVGIYDGTGSPGTTVSAWHTGSGNFETLTTTRTIGAAANTIRIWVGNFTNEVGTNIYYVDSAMLTVSNSAIPYVSTDQEIDKIKSGQFSESLYKSTFKNRIINGQMYIDQRLCGGALSISGFANPPTYSVDRWGGEGQPGFGVFTMQRAAAAGLTQHLTCLTITTTTADASIGAGRAYYIIQKIEGYNWRDAWYGSALAKSATLSFWVKSSLTGKFDISFRNSAADRNYATTYTIFNPNAWEFKAVTFPGCQDGSWVTDTGEGLDLVFGLGYGSNYQGTQNVWQAPQIYSSSTSTNLLGTLSANLNIAGVQLELGPTPTAFEYRPFHTELALCQRYYEKSYDLEVAPGTSTNAGMLALVGAQTGATTVDYSEFSFKVTKRLAPATIKLWTPGGVANKLTTFTTGGVGTDRTMTTNNVSQRSFHVFQAAALEYWCNGHWTVDAEM